MLAIRKNLKTSLINVAQQVVISVNFKKRFTQKYEYFELV